MVLVTEQEERGAVSPVPVKESMKDKARQALQGDGWV